MAALIIVDVQNDFVEGGSLAVEGGKSIVPGINELIKSRHWGEIVATKDWHPKNHVSFASSHGQPVFSHYKLRSGDKEIDQTLWPDHCVQNSFGAALVDGLDTQSVTKVVDKGQDPKREYYSAFRDVFKEDETDLPGYLKSKGIKDVYVVGLALDYCVLNTALDAAAYGFNTTVLTAYTKAISQQGAVDATKALKEAGVHVS